MMYHYSNNITMFVNLNETFNASIDLTKSYEEYDLQETVNNSFLSYDDYPDDWNPFSPWVFPDEIQCVKYHQKIFSPEIPGMFQLYIYGLL